MERTSANLIESAGRAMAQSQELGNELDSRAAALSSAVESAYRQAGECGHAFREQAKGLVKASQAAATQVRALRDTDLEKRRDAFLHTATSMIENLNSSAIDLNRILKDDIPEDIWRSYHKGDRSIFARRLLRGKDRYSVPDIKERYEEDEKFRDQVSRYIKQFEGLLAQANDCDPENVLSATFLTADVGKLYLILSRSLGRAQ